jgi:hypothetical protein
MFNIDDNAKSYLAKLERMVAGKYGPAIANHPLIKDTLQEMANEGAGQALKDLDALSGSIQDTRIRDTLRSIAKQTGQSLKSGDAISKAACNARDSLVSEGAKMLAGHIQEAAGKSGNRYAGLFAKITAKALNKYGTKQ